MTAGRFSREQFKEVLKRFDAQIKGGLIPDMPEYLQLVVIAHNAYIDMSLQVLENDIKEALDG